MRRQFVRRGTGLVAAMLAGGAVAVRPAAAQARPIVIGYQEQPDWLLFVARDLGLFEKAGLSPTFVKFDSGPPMIEEIRHGRLDLASVGSVAFLIGLSQGLDWTMIGINPEGAYAQGLVAHKDSDILTPTDLKGKRVGLVQGATAQFGFLMLMRQHGIRAEQVTVVNMAPEAQLRALEARQIDAAMVWEPWMHRMIRNANARIVETEGNLGIYTNVDCYSVRRDWLGHNRETALRFLRALVVGERRRQQGSQGRLSSVGPRGRAQQCGGRGDLRRGPAAPDLRMDQPALHLFAGQGRATLSAARLPRCLHDPREASSRDWWTWTMPWTCR